MPAAQERDKFVVECKPACLEGEENGVSLRAEEIDNS